MGKKLSSWADGVCSQIVCADHDRAVLREELRPLAVEPGRIDAEGMIGPTCHLPGADEDNIARFQLEVLLLQAILQVLLADPVAWRQDVGALPALWRTGFGRTSSRLIPPGAISAIIALRWV
jgi:hypothetical protein